MVPKEFPKRLVILGGGTAGWMSAAYLDRSFNRPGRKRLEITLVESPTVPRIGVGEATVPTLRNFCQFIGIDEPTLMRRTNATFKHGIDFLDWNGPGSEYFHSFEALEAFRGFNPAPSWLARRARGQAAPFDEESGIQKEIARAGKAPKRMVDPDYLGALPYAYHLDAQQFADLLSDISKARGVSHVLGDVTDASLSADGYVSQLNLADGGKIDGDFFVDCSGFSSVLLEGALNTPFVGFDDYLLCDSAVAFQLPYEAPRRIDPFTKAQALSSGWMWRIGLQQREGVGYVYAQQFQTPDDAEQELRTVAGVPPYAKARHLKMRVGMPAQTWNRNVIAIGLAGGFIEPLESTSIHMCELALEFLVRYFPLSGVNSAARDRLNRMMNERYLELRDFIVAHYCVSRRRDTSFWREVTDPLRIPESLRQKLGIWKDRHPSSEDNDYARVLFAHSNWQAVLYGLEAVEKGALQNALIWCPDPGAHLRDLAVAKQNALEGLAPHDLWLEGLQTIPVRENW